MHQVLWWKWYFSTIHLVPVSSVFSACVMGLPFQLGFVKWHRRMTIIETWFKIVKKNVMFCTFFEKSLVPVCSVVFFCMWDVLISTIPAEQPVCSTSWIFIARADPNSAKNVNHLYCAMKISQILSTGFIKQKENLRIVLCTLLAQAVRMCI